jgi:hypothetical protein
VISDSFSSQFGVQKNPRAREDNIGHAETVFSNSSADKFGDCGKLPKVNAGEVAERLKAAVC